MNSAFQDLNKDVLQRANIEDMVKLLDQKANVEDVNSTLQLVQKEVQKYVSEDELKKMMD